MSDEKEGTIRDRAYAIWQEEGEPEGRDADHWHRAESELAAPASGNDSENSASVDASGLPTEDAATAAPSSAEPAAEEPGPVTKLKRKTAKVAKSL